MVRTARGVFPPSLNLVMNSDDVVGKLTISAILQDSMRYLDAPPPVITARFGVASQRWTIVGTVGHYSTEPEHAGQANLSLQLEKTMASDFNRNLATTL
jgi:hypothetical protein